MKMDKLFAGLIAFVAGVALSAGSAFATNGYVGGDFARMKLVPHYEAGDSKATMIGIQNLSPQEASTMAFNQDVSDLKAYLGGQTITAAQETNLEAAPVSLGADDVVTTAGGLSRANFATTYESVVSRVQAALEAAEGRTYTEHLFVSVKVYDTMDMMMGSVNLCLAEHQFGYVILQGPEMQDWQPMDSDQNMILSVMDEDISEYGYVKVMAEGRKFTGCGATAPNQLRNVDTNAATPAIDVMGANSMVATWAIIQDTGMGFFGTEVPTSTFTMASNVGAAPAADATDDDGDPELACYTSPTFDTGGTAPTANQLPHSTGNFMMARCGLIPERHIITADADADGSSLDEPTTTINANAIARYDIGGESMVYVWLAKGGDAETMPSPSMRRMLDVVVKCEDGTVMMDADIDGNMSPFKVPAPNKVTMIDPSMGDVGMATEMCEGDRGVLKITMPNNSHAGMVFTHITQMMGHYRMNFPGYSMAADGLQADGTTAELTERCTAESANKCRGMD